MRKFFLPIGILLFCSKIGLAQDSVNLRKEKVIFITKFNIDKDAGKGNVYYLNNYTVHINWKKAQRLNGKTLKISGKVTLVKGLTEEQAKYMQGQTGESKHIFKPTIIIVK